MTRRPSFADLSTIPHAGHSLAHLHTVTRKLHLEIKITHTLSEWCVPILAAGVFGQVELHGQLTVLGLKHLAGLLRRPDTLPGAAQISWTLFYVEFL